MDLLVQAREIVINNRKYTGYPPPYCSGVVVFLNNTKAKIVITPNDSGKLTIKLDYRRLSFGCLLKTKNYLRTPFSVPDYCHPGQGSGCRPLHSLAFRGIHQHQN